MAAEYYYSYQGTETSSLSSDSGLGIIPASAGHAGGFDPRSTSSDSLPVASRLGTVSEKRPFVESFRPPLLAPDCSACGTRSDHIRYVCDTCGITETDKDNAPIKSVYGPRRALGESEQSDGSGQSDGSRETEGGAAPFSPPGRTQTSTESDPFGFGLYPTPQDVPSNSHDRLSANDQTSSATYGFELCSGCIEQHGVAHANAASHQARDGVAREEGNRSRKGGPWRHTFREQIWDSHNWHDVGE